MRCPLCNVDLQMSERNGIEIDYCPTCRGVWLDRGELDKIIERSRNNYTSQHEFKQEDLHGHGYHGDKKKKYKSLLEELFD